MSVNTALMTDQLLACEIQLTQAKNSMREYKSAISANWKADEATLIDKAVDNVIAKINAVIHQLDPLGADIRNSVEEIKQEEEAARKREQIEQIHAKLKSATDTADELKRKLDRLVNAYQNNGASYYSARDKKAIAEAETAYKNALREVEELKRALDQISR